MIQFNILFFMTHISPKTKSICLEIMEELMNRPCAAIFLQPVDTNGENSQNYSNVIKRPMSLNLIYQKLQNNEYPNITQWDRDMNLIWGNAEKFSGKGSCNYTLANELHRQYDKLYQRIKILRLAKWSRVVFSYKAKIENIFESIPPVLGALSQLPERAHDAQLKPFSEEELNLFIRMSAYLANPPDSKKMGQIIQHYQPKTFISSGNAEIDVNDLTPQTLYALRDYVTFRLAEMNIAYPK